MKTKEPIEIKGRVRLQVFEKEGGKLLHDTGFMDNLITTAGKAQIALLAGDASATPFTYLAVGTSSTAASVSQTALVAEITDTGLERAAATVTRTTTTVTNDTLSLVKTWTATGSKTVEEIGIFNAGSTGTMLGRRVTGTVSLGNGNVLAATYTIAFA